MNNNIMKKNKGKLTIRKKWKKAQAGITLEPQPQDYKDQQEYFVALGEWANSQQEQLQPVVQRPTGPVSDTPTPFQIPEMNVDASFQQAGRDLSQPLSKKEKKPFQYNGQIGDAAVLGLSAVAALLPNQKPKSPIVRPGLSYNEHPYGTGSQALAQKGAKLKAYNPNMAAKDTAFQSWYLKNTLEGQNKIPYSDKLAYDYFSFFKNNGVGNIKDHFPDTYKRPNHPTFSDESIYSIPENPGGHWKGDKFIPRKGESGITISNEGYRQGPPPKGTKYRIPSNRISMKGDSSIPEILIGTGSDGTQQVMVKGQEYLFPNAEYVDEQPLAKKGAKIPKHGHKLPKGFEIDGKPITSKQRKFFDDLCEMEEGGKMKKTKGKYVSKSYNDGGQLEIEDDKFTPISDSTLMINGDSHEDGGTMVKYGNKTVEAEKGEPLSIGQDGAAIIFGNMHNPVTGNKFKTDAMKLAKKEAKVNKLMDTALTLVNNSNPSNKWDSLKFNAGTAMMTGARIKSKQLLSVKNHLGDLQQGMLALKKEGLNEAENGLRIDSTEHIGKAQRGVEIPGTDRRMTYSAYMKYKKSQQTSVTNPQSVDNQPTNQTLSVAQRHNNPGNMKYEKWMSKFGAVPGESDNLTKDGTTYAKFPDLESGLTAMRTKMFQRPTFGNKTVSDAAYSWTGGEPYKNLPKGLISKKMNTLTPEEQKLVFDSFTLGEDSKKYNYEGVVNQDGTPKTVVPQTPVELNRVTSPTFGPQPPQKGGPNLIQGNEYNPKIQEYPNVPVESDAEGLNFTQILPEIYGALSNKLEPVHLQQYNPELFEPYQISLQDRRNRITSQGRATRQFLQDNAGAQAVLAAQEAQNTGEVDAEEFRINQGIANDVTNKNVALLNESKRFNLGLADTQYTRQSKAKSITKSTNQTILNSVSNKVLQNKLENRTLQVYENLYPHFRYDENYKLQKEGDRAIFNINGPNNTTSTGDGYYTTFDGQGNLLRRTVNTKSINQKKLEELNLIDKSNDNISSIFRKTSNRKPNFNAAF